jgi:hypothetical protein
MDRYAEYRAYLSKRINDLCDRYYIDVEAPKTMTADGRTIIVAAFFRISAGLGAPWSM